MKTDANDIDNLIARCLAAEATSEEVAFVEEWKAKEENNRRYFEQMKIIFEKATAAPVSMAFDTDEAWMKMQGQLARTRQGPWVPVPSKPTPYRLYWRIAAGIVLLLSVGLLASRFFGSSSPRPIELAAHEKMRQDTLPDGSALFLNRQTTIQYTSDEETRVAKLQGEAYFNVRHDQDHAFMVVTDGVFILDMGTSFNVKAYADSSTVEVVVDEGEVRFYSEGDTGVHLKAGDMGVYNRETGTFTKGEPAANTTAYKTRLFMFNDDSLSTVVETLNRVYDTKISIAENLAKCRLTVSFDNERIEEIAHVIAETLGLTIVESDHVIRLQGSGCGGDENNE